MSDLYCPYCDEEVEPNDDSYEPNVDYECHCDKCGKNFIYSIEYSPDYSSNKVPCMNGEEHNFVEINGYPKEYFVNRLRCEYCSKEIIKELKTK
jgi:hypothetical protein